MNNRFLLLFLGILLVGCQPLSIQPAATSFYDWKYADLRVLDPVDTSLPGQDIIAVYTRELQRMDQIRIDFLDLTSDRQQDVYIFIDNKPGGSYQAPPASGRIKLDIAWDYLIAVPADGDIESVDEHNSPVYGMRLIISRDIDQDNIVVSFNRNTLPIINSQAKLQVITTPPHRNLAADLVKPFSLDAPPPARAKIIFAFWNTFSASTPAEAIRSWAGAHSGPNSSRHGLKYLLDAVNSAKVPIFLLDVVKPETLSALDYLDANSLITKLNNQGLIGLPSELNNYGNSDFLFFMDNILLLSVNDYAKYIKADPTCRPSTSSSNVVILHIPGFSLLCRNLLINNALNKSPTPLILGGDFKQSVLGEPSISSGIFFYVHNHPWIQALSTNDLPSFFEQIRSETKSYRDPAGNMTFVNLNDLKTTNPSAFQIYHEIYSALEQAPDNQITDLAWQVLSTLSQPAPGNLFSLRLNYLGGIGNILSASEWAAHPGTNHSCDRDFDYDNKPECILSNMNLFLIIEPEGGYISFAFARDASGIHQIIGPTWELVVGLSDPSEWNNLGGILSDPTQIPGAFYDEFNKLNVYDVKIMEDKVVMVDKQMTMRKVFTITTDSIHAEVYPTGSYPIQSYIPILIDPWLRFSPGWGDRYLQAESPLGIQWGIDSGMHISIKTNDLISFYAFNATRKALYQPEDPNYDYTPGHFLPFPMALAEIHSSHAYTVDILVNP